MAIVDFWRQRSRTKGEDGSLTLECVESHNYLKMTNGRLGVNLDLSCESAVLELPLDGGMLERDDAQRECTEREFLGEYAER